MKLFLPFHNRKHFSSGFTLIELLITTVMSSIVISTLLYFMLDVMRTNAKEIARKDTLQEMQVALDFITNELEEAVYIYTGEELEDREITSEEDDGIKDIFDLPDSGNLEPILVFWKLEDAPYTSDESFPDDCTSEDLNVSEQTCEELKISQRTYTLVAYLQDNDPTDTWKGESVIYRYQLRKYDDFSTLAQETGYIDPQRESSFANWPYDSASNLPSSDYQLTVNRGGSSNALVDFVDEPNNSNLNGDFTCASGYQRTPQTVSNWNSFYACIEDVSGAKTVTVHLRGNPNGRTNFELGDDFTPLPTLQSTAILRGAFQE
jgi:prepilin-type N-terminal cleavage/methylation domain-containing protein